jgi:hypothetical protein
MVQTPSSARSNILIAADIDQKKILVQLAAGKKLSAVVWIMLACGVLQAMTVAAFIFMSTGSAQKDQFFFIIPMIFTFVLAASAYSNTRMNAQRKLADIDRANSLKF